jgi:hypothetical protein
VIEGDVSSCGSPGIESFEDFRTNICPDTTNLFGKPAFHRIKLIAELFVNNDSFGHDLFIEVIRIILAASYIGSDFGSFFLGGGTTLPYVSSSAFNDGS